MTHDCRMGWAPLAQMIAEELPASQRAKPQALVRQQATEWKEGRAKLGDFSHPAGAKAAEAAMERGRSVAKELTTAVDGFTTVAEDAADSMRSLASGWVVPDPALRSILYGTVKVGSDVVTGKQVHDPRVVTINVAAGTTRNEVMSALGSRTDAEFRRAVSQIVAGYVAKPTNKPQPEWIEWAGGASSPVPGECDVDIKVRTGKVVRCVRAGEILAAYWHHDNCNLDILAYRVVPQ